MGWTDSHLHQFEKDGKYWAVPDPDQFEGDTKIINESRVPLDAVLTAERDSLAARSCPGKIAASDAGFTHFRDLPNAPAGDAGHSQEVGTQTIRVMGSIFRIDVWSRRSVRQPESLASPFL